MSFFSNLTIRKKLAVAFGLICVVCLALGVAGIMLLSRVNESTRAINDKWLPGIKLLDSMHSAHSGQQRALLAIAICTDKPCKEIRYEMYAKQKDVLHKGFEKFVPLTSTPEEKELLSTLNQQVLDYESKAETAIRLDEEGKEAESDQITLNSAKSAYELAYATGDKVIDMFNNGAQKATDQAESDYRSGRIICTFAIVIAIIIAIIAASLLTRMIATPLTETVGVLERLADKDFTAELKIDTQDEVGQLARALNATVRTMREVLGTVVEGAGTVARSTKEISISAENMAKESRLQSQHVQQVAAATQEMASVMADISINTEKAANASRESASSATQGGVVVGEALESMQHISDSSSAIGEKMSRLGQRSEEIGKVISVIQDIAEQTNLLALNAAIESARAGEHGRGFAVVAGEVRRLAERTRESTEEIAQMIEAIQTETRDALNMTEAGRTNVEAGLEKTSRAGDALHAIIKLANAAEEMITLIATASNEQNAASKEISSSVEQISRSIEGSSASTEQAAQSCSHLEQLAANLEDVVRQFRLSNDNRAEHYGSGRPLPKLAA